MEGMASLHLTFIRISWHYIGVTSVPPLNNPFSQQLVSDHFLRKYV
jgi:hypothetical protein